MEEEPKVFRFPIRRDKYARTLLVSIREITKRKQKRSGDVEKCKVGRASNNLFFGDNFYFVGTDRIVRFLRITSSVVSFVDIKNITLIFLYFFPMNISFAFFGYNLYYMTFLCDVIVGDFFSIKCFTSITK